MGMNNVTLVGRMVADAELRYTPNGNAVANFRLAVNRSYTDKSGERQADFINCVVWNKQAENLANYVKKGHRVGITGSIQTRNYENDQGQRVYVTEVLANGVTFLEPRSNQQQGQSQQQQGSPFQQQGNQQQNQGQQQNNNFPQQGNQNQQGSPFQQDGQPIDINDDDLPF